MKLSQPDVAVTYFLQSLECFESIGNQRSVAIELNHLSSILFQMEEDEKAMYYSKKAYQLAIELMDTAIIASTASNLAIRYAYLSKPDTAFFYANLSLDLARKGQSETRISYAYLRMALINIDLKDYDQVIAYADSALAINPKYRGVVTGLKYKAQAYLAQNNLNQANICIEEAIEVAQQGDDLEVIFVLHQIASDVYERRGMHVSALEQYKIYSSLKDSVLNIEKLAKMESLLAKYESEKTAQQIAQLIQQNEINDLKNKQQYLIFFLISVFLIVIGLTAFFVLKQRMNKQHAQMAIKKEQLLRSQINPHFIFNALSSIRGFLFEKNGFKNAIDYLGKFAKLMRMVLDHSAKELVTLEEEINALRIYFDIQKMRFNSTFDYCMSIDPNIALDQVKVPPLMAQPFVENSIEHGFKNIDYHGEIEFSCKQDGMFIRFSISDNGVGIHHVKGGQDHESRALEIFKERMELIRNQFKMKLTFLIRDLGETGAKSGTKIEYTLPISQI